MANNTRDAVGTYIYEDDAGGQWSVKLTGQVAQAGGFQPVTAQTTGLKGPWTHHRRMRHVGLKRGTGNAKVFRNRVPIAKLNDDHYKLTNLAVTLDGQSWTITGRVGEKVSL